MVGSLVTPLVTPYNPHNRLDFTSLKFLVEHLVRTRTKTVVLGTTVGEGDQLSLIERQKLIDRVLRYGLEPLKVFVALGTNTLDDWEAEWTMIRNLPVHGLYLTYEKLLEAGIKRNKMGHLVFSKGVTNDQLPCSSRFKRFRANNT